MLRTDWVENQTGHVAEHNEIGMLFNNLWLNVKSNQFGAKGDGSTDDTTAIQSALTACPEGGIVYLPAGIYRTSAPINLDKNKTLKGAHGGSWTYRYGAPTALRPLASFSGSAVIRLRDKEQVGSSTDQGGQRIQDLSIDGQDIPSAIVHGIYASGFVGGVMLDRLAVANMTGIGIYTDAYTRTDTNNYYPRGWYVNNVKVEFSDGNNWELHLMTDCSFNECLGHNSVNGDGFNLNGCGEAHFTNCRATWNKGKGFRILGNLGGALCLTSCTTDRSNEDGFYVGTVVNGPITFANCQARRDGRNNDSGGGNWAGFTTNNTGSQVRYTGCAVSPGVNDPGMAAATMSPQFGVRHLGSSDAAHSAGFYWGFSGTYSDAGGNTSVRFDRSCTGGTGTSASNAAPTYDLTLGGQVVDNPNWHPVDHGLKTWAYDPMICSTSAAATSGLLYFQKVHLKQPMTITNIVMHVGTAGATLTSGQNFAALYRADRTLIAVTADQSTAWTSTGVKTMALSGGPYSLAAGDYYVAHWSVGTTPVGLLRSSPNVGALVNVGFTQPNFRQGTADSGLTTTAPSTFSSTQSSSASAGWAALS